MSFSIPIHLLAEIGTDGILRRFVNIFALISKPLFFTASAIFSAITIGTPVSASCVVR